MHKAWSITNTKPLSQGFTLIELLLYVALIGILLGAVTSFFITSVDARVRNQSTVEVNEQGNFALERIAHVIRNASAITTPATGTTSSGFTATVPTGSLSPTILSVAGGVLQLKEGSAAATAITNSNVRVTSLSVANLTRAGAPSILQITLTLARYNPANQAAYSYSRTFTTSVGLRQ